MRIISYFLLLIIILFGITFAALNSETVSINYYLGSFSLPLSLLLVLIFACGCLCGMAASIGLLIKTKYKNHRLSKQLELAEKEITNLRAIVSAQEKT